MRCTDAFVPLELQGSSYTGVTNFSTFFRGGEAFMWALTELAIEGEGSTPPNDLAGKQFIQHPFLWYPVYLSVHYFDRL